MPPTNAEPRTTIEGTVARITFKNEENRYVVFRLQEQGKSGMTTVVGRLYPIHVGEHLRVRGRWVVNKKFGEQFEADHCEITAPRTADGIERYLASGVIKGVGPVMAQRLVAAFGEETLAVIREHPHRLKEVPGIGPKRRRDIAAASRQQKAFEETMVFLQGHGVGAGLAARIYKLYGEQAAHVVRRDPYRLVSDIYGVGFRTADSIAGKLGMRRDAPERRRAALLYALTVATEEGHTYVPADELLERVTALLGEDTGSPAPELEDLSEHGQVVREGTGGSTRVYLAALHAQETHLALGLHALQAARSQLPTIKVERAIEWFEQRNDIALTAAQQDCVRRVAQDKVLLITGGPGTGKTTILRAVCAIYRAKDMHVVLGAPTGRAANRMADVTGLPAKTLHRLLEFNPRHGGFMRGAEHPLVGDLFIIDEFSMVDLPLAAALIDALPPHAALVMVGDADQLPSVGPGQVLRDLLDSGEIPSIRLTEIMRQRAQSAIVAHAHEIRRGRVPDIADIDRAGSGEDCLWMTAEHPDEVVTIIKDLHRRIIPERLTCDPCTDIQVLCPVHKGVVGVANLNAELQALLNPVAPQLMRGDRTFRQGDKVIQLRNNYDRGVFNGDLGVVAEVRPDRDELLVRFDSDICLYEHSDLDELALAYAVTVHKSQGSEYRAVILPVITQHYILLDRNLLYTGLTRGKELVVLVGTRRALELAVRNQRSYRRYSSLAERLSARLSEAAPTDRGP